MTTTKQPDRLSTVERSPHYPTGTVADLTGPETGQIGASSTYHDAARGYGIDGLFITAPVHDAPPSVRVVVLGGWSNDQWIGQRAAADRVEIAPLTEPWVTVAGPMADSRGLGVAVVAASWLTPVEQTAKADTATAGSMPFGATLDLGRVVDDVWIGANLNDAVLNVRLTRWNPDGRPHAVVLSAVPGDTSHLLAVAVDRRMGVGFVVVPAASARRLTAELPRVEQIERQRRETEQATAAARFRPI